MPRKFESDRIPWSEPPCCPAFFICPCYGTLVHQCPRHTESPCGRTKDHLSLTREQWHHWAGRWEQQLLDQHIRQHLASA